MYVPLSGDPTGNFLKSLKDLLQQRVSMGVLKLFFCNTIVNLHHCIYGSIPVNMNTENTCCVMLRPH